MSEEFIGAAALVGRYGLALIFLAAALPKLLARSEFAEALSNYKLLPGASIEPVARWLPRLELLIALVLLVGIAPRVGAAVAGGLLLSFSAAVGVNLARGRQIECGCSGTVTARRIGWGLVVGDIALAGVALLVAATDPAASELTTSDTGAALAIAALLVVGYLLASTWRSVRAAALELARGGAS